MVVYWETPFFRGTGDQVATALEVYSDSLASEPEMKAAYDEALPTLAAACRLNAMLEAPAELVIRVKAKGSRNLQSNSVVTYRTFEFVTFEVDTANQA